MSVRPPKQVGRGKSNRDGALDRAKAAIEEGRLDEADSLARDILTKKPDHPGASHVLGVVMLARGSAADAVPLLTMAAAAGDPVVETHLAMALRQSGRAGDALPWLERAVARQPAFEPAFPELGTLLHSLNRFEEAEAVLRKGLKTFPGSAEAWCALGRVLIMRGDRNGAQLAFARALVERPAHPGALFGYACALRDEADFTRAADFFGKTLAQIPEWAEARLQLGYCLLELDQWDEAMACIRAAIKLDPGLYDTARHVLVRSSRGRFWLRPSVVAEMLGRDAGG